MKTFALLSAALLGTALARCPNGCSNQGLCGPNSQCKCYRNFQGSDCSERVCYYALSFIDTPFGDLNADGTVSMAVTYEEQTQDYALEGYSINYGSARPVDGSSESGRWDEAHFYRECSNKGICNRKTGQCDCFPGYEGEGCQRTTCPGTSAGVTCSGHGLCLNAYHKLGSTYGLWDKEKTMKCECDKGYSGPDCSIRQCPQGPDPVAHSDKVTTSLQKIAFGAFTYKSAFLQEEDSFDKVMSGPVYFTVTVTDDYGDEWTTNTLSIHYITTCHTGVTDIDCRSKPVFNPATTGCPVTGDPATADKSSTYDSTDYACARNYGYMEENNAAGFDWYAKNTIADDLNVSLQGLPNGAVKEPYVWMWYTDKSNNLEPTPDADHPTADDVHLAEESKNPTAPDLDDEKKTALQNELYVFKEANKAVADSGISAVENLYSTYTRLRANDIKYPSANIEGKALYWESPRTRYPDFNSNGDQDKQWQDCGRVDDNEDVNSDGTLLKGRGRANKGKGLADGTAAAASAPYDVSSTEGLCLYISSDNKVVTN